MHVTLDLWLALGERLPKEFKQQSRLRSEANLEIAEGANVRRFFQWLAARYQIAEERIYGLDDDGLRDNVIVLLNGRMLARTELYETMLRDGDRITVVAVHMGG